MSVTGHFAEGGFTSAIKSVSVTDVPQGTDVLVRTTPTPGPGTRPAGHLIIRVNRILDPDQGVHSARTAGVLGHVTANWLAPDGTKAHDHFAVVRNAATDHAAR